MQSHFSAAHTVQHRLLTVEEAGSRPLRDPWWFQKLTDWKVSVGMQFSRGEI
jgi:hypothetical protein